mgnify:CR=1 FL=1
MQGLLKLFKKKPMLTALTNYDPVIRQVPDPDRVVIPLDYPGRVRYQPTVEKEDTVRKGQVIAKSPIGNSLCASISGTVKDITSVWTAQSHHSPAIIIEGNGEEPMSPDELFAGIDDSAIADNFDAAMKKLRLAGVAPPWAMSGREYGDDDQEIPALPPIKAFIVTGVRQETTILTSQLLLEQQADKVADGLQRISALLPEARVCLTVPKDFRSWAWQKFADHAEVVFVPGNYTGRIERELVSKVLGYSIPNRESYRYHGIAVLDVEFLLAMVDALDGKSSLTQKCLTISGTNMDQAITVRFPLGTSIAHVLASQGLNAADYTRHVVGGPMMGFAQFSDSTPLTYNNGLYLVAEDVSPFDSIAPCINCGRCSRACPENIQVHLVNRMIEFGQTTEARNYHPEACHECGVCASVCPAERPIVQLLHFCNHEMVHGERYNWITGDNQ